MWSPRFCLAQVNFPALSVSGFLALAAEAGARTVDLHPGLSGEATEDVLAAVEDSDVDVVLVSPLPDWFAHTDGGTRIPPGFHDLVIVSAATGGAIGIPSPLYEDETSRPSDRSIGEALCLLSHYALSRGATVALEPVGSSVVRPGARGCIGSLAAARDLLELHEITMPLVADSYCLATAGTDLESTWCADDVCVIQLADWRMPTSVRLMPGEGSLPLARWLAVAKAKQPIAVGIEVFPLTRDGREGDLAIELVAETRALVARAAGASGGRG
jgi:sugar phosphate isomerase/epimerase